MIELQLPKSMGKIYLFFQNYVLRIPEFSTQLGITPAEVAKLQTDFANFAYLMGFTNQFKDRRAEYSAFRKRMLWGPVGETAPQPVFESVALPEEDSTGILTNLTASMKKVRASTAYDEQIAEALGLAQATEPSKEDSAYIPDLKPKGSENGSPVVGFKKARYDGARMYIRRPGETTWTDAGTFVRSPAVIPVDSETNQPETFEVRAKLLRGNNPVTAYSEIYTTIRVPA